MPVLLHRSALDRREFLRRGGMVAAAGAAPLLLGSQLQGSAARAAMAVPTRPAPLDDPDQLFAQGLFEAADRGYARQLRRDPDDAHALSQRGYIALLSNRFGAAETFLAEAVKLAPGDTFSVGQLADCYVRQDKFTSAIPLLNQTGSQMDTAAALQYAALAGIPYQVSGPESSRAPVVSIDPLPITEVSANGGAPVLVYWDTGSEVFNFTKDLADELGLTAVSSATGVTGGQEVTLYYGVLESLRIGEIEVRNIPVQWTAQAGFPAPPPGLNVVGVIGNVLFYHFLTTLDYQGRGLVLRQKSEAAQCALQAAASREGYRPLPLWIADTKFPCTLGSLNGFGPHVISMDTGGPNIGIATTAKVAKEAGIAIDYTHLREFQGHLVPTIIPDRISLGDAAGRRVPGDITSNLPGSAPPLQFGFDTIGNFTHEFFKPFAVTLDVVGMNLYVTPAVPDGA